MTLTPARPNPADGEMTIRFEPRDRVDTQVEIYDVVGRGLPLRSTDSAGPAPRWYLRRSTQMSGAPPLYDAKVIAAASGAQ